MGYSKWGYIRLVAITSHMKFNKSKYLGRGNAGYMYKLEDERLDSRHTEMDLEVLVKDLVAVECLEVVGRMVVRVSEVEV